MAVATRPSAKPCLEAWASGGGGSRGGTACPLCRVISHTWGTFGAAALRADAAWARGEEGDRVEFRLNCAKVGRIADARYAMQVGLGADPPAVWRSWRCTALPLLLGAVVAIAVAVVLAPAQGRF